jgi:hypothetical protein
MPPRKKAKKETPVAAAADEPDATDVATPKEEEGEKPLIDVYFDDLEAVILREGMFGHILLKGINREDDEDEEDEDGDGDVNGSASTSKVPYTAEEILTMRCYLINDSREKALDKAAKLATGGQTGGMMMFNTQTGNTIIAKALKEVKRISKMKSVSTAGVAATSQIDSLFGLTRMLHRYDCWIQDNECWGEGGELDELITLLGTVWKGVLSKTDTVLGIDNEYTRPAIIHQLEEFAELVEQTDCCEKASFEWK